MIFNIYLFAHDKNNSKNENIIEQPKEVGVVEIRGILNGVSMIYVIRYGENDEILNITCAGGRSAPNINFNDYIVNFNK